MSLLASLKGKGPSGFGYGSTAEDVTEGLSLAGKTMLVTGAGSGLGTETVRVLAKRGARVLATGRTEESVRRSCGAFAGEIVVLACELSKPASVRTCADAVRAAQPRLDAIVCNAGIMALPKLEQASGYELQFFTNHIGHFLLVTGLLDHLAEKARIVVVSSAAHTRTTAGGVRFDDLSGEKAYSPWQAYGQSKLCNILFAKQLAKRLAGSGKTANALHPGVIATPLGRHMPSVARRVLSAASPLFLKSVGEGAATECYVATHPSLEGVTGEYFADCNVAKPSAFARDPALDCGRSPNALPRPSDPSAWRSRGLT
jgi:NAD(P)-dependent dehydrogenase (short-subunit alcohol dehydrogenase family)